MTQDGRGHGQRGHGQTSPIHGDGVKGRIETKTGKPTHPDATRRGGANFGL